MQNIKSIWHCTVGTESVWGFVDDFMILVTGATGRIGTPLVGSLIEHGEQVRVLTRNPGFNTHEVEIIHGDITDPAAVRKAAEGASLIYHLAGVSDRPELKKRMYRINVHGTRNLVNGTNAKIVYLSSAEVYGDTKPGSVVSESTACKPQSLYGRTKELAERMVLGRNGIVVRSAKAYGENVNTELYPFLSRMESGKMGMVGSGGNYIHWIHISDLVQALLLAGKSDKQGLYLVAGLEVGTQAKLLDLLALHLHVPPPKRRMSAFVAKAIAGYGSIVSEMRGRKQDITPDTIKILTEDRKFDITKACSELGFEPKIDYEEGTRGLVERYLADKAGGAMR